MTIALILAAASLGGEPSFMDAVVRDWSCPGAQALGASGGSTSSQRGALMSARGKAKLRTREPYDVVAKWYEDKVDAVAGIDGSRQVSGRGSAGFAVGADDRMTIDDSAVGPKKRPVSLRMISWRKGDKTMTIVITRAKEEEWTHIDIMFRDAIPRENKPNP